MSAICVYLQSVTCRKYGAMEKKILPLNSWHSDKVCVCLCVRVCVCVMMVGGFEIKEQLKKTGEKSRECAQTHKRDSLTIDREQWWKWQL